MNKNLIEWLAGLFVLAGAAVLLYLAVVLGGEQLGNGQQYELRARFTNASGIRPGSPVRIAGVGVGEVTDLTLDREQLVAIVRFTVPEDIELFNDTMAAVRTSGLIGDRFIEILPGGSGIPLEPGDMIVDTEGTVNIESLISRFAFGEVNGKNGDPQD
ncbi:MAG: outer membrane lipid asymmetry maintenance protein MlaD [Opitutales bacterium]